ncbi:MAG: class I SAM-dependent RNA methyltransferase [Mollicutes bacterium]|nr:class I SAM-dependent RNA methyltransferase [Mollicutes bacterium]
MPIKLTTEKLDYFGRGIAYLDKKIIFIENALPGEEVLIEITKEKKSFAEGKVIDYLTTSPERVIPKCPYYEECGGCNLSHFKEQLHFKKTEFVSLIKSNCHLDVNPIVIESPKNYYYRNKVTLKIENYKWGYYENQSHQFVSINQCLIAKESINKIIKRQDLFKIATGEIVIRSNYNDEILISINTESKYEVDIEELKKDNRLLGIIINDKIYYGQDSFIEFIDNYLFKVSINSFFQVNIDILKEIFKILSKTNTTNMIDLYCGVGVLGTVINKEKLYGIENSYSSIKDALLNAKMNKQENNYYLLGDSSKISEIKDNIDLIIVDPPRSGINKKTMEHILNLNVGSIIYMSCNPHTLSRDLKKLKDKYCIKECYLFDMFPQTYHFETICILTKK